MLLIKDLIIPEISSDIYLGIAPGILPWIFPWMLQEMTTRILKEILQELPPGVLPGYLQAIRFMKYSKDYSRLSSSDFRKINLQSFISYYSEDSNKK